MSTSDSLRAVPVDEFSRLEHAAREFSEAARVHFENSNLDEAEKILLKCYEIDEILGSAQGMASTLRNLATIAARRGNTHEAFRFEHMSVIANPDPHPPKVVALAYQFLAHHSVDQREFAKASEHARKALEIRRENPTESDHAEAVADILNILGTSTLLGGKLDEAEDILHQALRHEEPIGRKNRLSAIYGNLGTLYLNRGQFDQAESMFLKAMAIHKELDAADDLAADYGNMGLVQYRRGNLAEARKLMTEAHDRARAVKRDDIAAQLQAWLDNPPQFRQSANTQSPS
jgi:tetratricopeptide (TPR) repeat protein